MVRHLVMSIKATLRDRGYKSIRTMKPALRLWIAVLLAVVLALPGTPALAVPSQSQGHDCCLVTPASDGRSDNGDCADNTGSHHTGSVCSDAGTEGPWQAPNCCVHCALAAVHATYAYWSTPVAFAVEASAYVPPSQARPFLPAVPVDRLERPPKVISFQS
ncbi:MAG: hypothetical protein U1F54_18085 [Burkholderiales bacterium]